MTIAERYLTLTADSDLETPLPAGETTTEENPTDFEDYRDADCFGSGSKAFLG